LPDVLEEVRIADHAAIGSREHELALLRCPAVDLALERLCVELDAVASAAMTARTRPDDAPAAVETLRNRLGVPPSASVAAG
jgi:hypothetical protein